MNRLEGSSSSSLIKVLVSVFFDLRIFPRIINTDASAFRVNVLIYFTSVFATSRLVVKDLDRHPRVF